MKLTACACALSLVFLPLTGQAGEGKVTSKYTSTAKSKAISFKEFKEEAGGFESLFAGLGGYQLEHLAGDDRSWINLRYQGKRVDLYGPTMEAGPGAFPRKANDVVEWRGVEKDGRFTPYAIIYRLEGTDEATQRNKTRLIVIQLDGLNSRIIGHAQGAHEDAEAKAIADKARPD